MDMTGWINYVITMFISVHTNIYIGYQLYVLTRDIKKHESNLSNHLLRLKKALIQIIYLG